MLRRSYSRSSCFGLVWFPRILLVFSFMLLHPGFTDTVSGQTPADSPQEFSPAQDSASPRRFALIVVGLPGDEEHQTRFLDIVSRLRGWLLERGGTSPERLVILFGRGVPLEDASTKEEPHNDSRQYPAATQNDLRDALANIQQELEPEDSLWVFLIGHGSQDQRHSWFHLPGPDWHEADWAGMLAPLRCREEVVWLTHSASGGMLRALSRPGRITIAATQDTGEINETRFPLALLKVLEQPAASLDSNHDSQLSVLELFRATAQAVTEHYERHGLAPTEHPQLDDNGDGRGSEPPDLLLDDPANVPNDSGGLPLDGALAARTRGPVER